MLAEYALTKEALQDFDGNPVDRFAAYFACKIPTLLIAGDADDVVPLAENGGKMIAYCEKNGIDLEYYIKSGCGHHPHSLEDVTPILRFCS